MSLVCGFSVTRVEHGECILGYFTNGGTNLNLIPGRGVGRKVAAQSKHTCVSVWRLHPNSLDQRTAFTWEEFVEKFARIVAGLLLPRRERERSRSPSAGSRRPD